MDLKQAVKILEAHNRWRRGEDVEPMVEPSDIGIAIDTLINQVKNNGVLDDVSDTLIAWEQFKKANWYESEAIDVEKMLMDKFQAIYGR